MLEELLGGPPLPAGRAGGAGRGRALDRQRPPRRLEAAGLVTIEADGRRREARLAGPHVAEALEALARIAGDTARPIGLTRGQRARGAARGSLVLRPSRRPRGRRARRPPARAGRARRARRHVHRPARAREHYRERFGVDPAALDARRPLVRACTDWTERRPHLAGALGAALLDAMLARRLAHAPPRRPRAQRHPLAAARNSHDGGAARTRPPVGTFVRSPSSRRPFRCGRRGRAASRAGEDRSPRRDRGRSTASRASARRRAGRGRSSRARRAAVARRQPREHAAARPGALMHATWTR